MDNIKFTFMCFALSQQNFAKAENSSSSSVAKYNDTNYLHFELSIVQDILCSRFYVMYVAPQTNLNYFFLGK